MVVFLIVVTKVFDAFPVFEKVSQVGSLLVERMKAMDYAVPTIGGIASPVLSHCGNWMECGELERDIELMKCS
jgi:hypothetical protein